MQTNPFFNKKLEAIEVNKHKSISQLLDEMAKTGFQGKKLGEAADTWSKMLRDKELTIILGLTGSLSTTGQWKIINWLIENRFIDVLVSTGANISEDILEAMGGTYWQGSHTVDDVKLLKHKIDRFYDVFADEMEYRKMESLIAEFINNLNSDQNYSSAEFLHLFGKELSSKGINSIVANAYKNKVPIFCPAIVDSAYGIAHLLSLKIGNKTGVQIDEMKGFEQLVKIKSLSKDTGAIFVGGGVPKDFIQLTTVARSLTESRRYERIYPHKYAIQITTDSAQWGGLSGCTFEEAISWGKTSNEGTNVQCHCDATIALPIIIHALAEKIECRANYPNFEWFFKE
ncbi:MAG: deoxyhypusine synthase [Crenarchaeota archaeon]|nr:deoxyhypusine synthase [Thermoproteota archaeon]